MYAHYIPFNLTSFITRLNALVQPVADYEAEHPKPSIELKTIFSDEGIQDGEAIKENHQLREQAQSMIAEESSKFRIYTYRAAEL